MFRFAPLRLSEAIPAEERAGFLRWAVRSLRKRRWWVIPAVCASAILTALFAPTLGSGWAPVLHVECAQGSEVVQTPIWTPAVVANSPFGGKVYDNGTIPPYIPGSPGYPNDWSALGAPAWNGTAAGAFFAANVSIFHSRNVTTWGPGANVRCEVPYLAQFLPPSPGGPVPCCGDLFGPISTPNATSDRGEASTAGFSGPDFYFNNSFTVPNRPSLSTCGLPGRWAYAADSHFTVWASAVVGGHSSFVPVVLPFAVSFQYWFPPNFGTWQIDNLSAPGGPGGGWAFSYSPCP